jgi:hypothetical protein
MSSSSRRTLLVSAVLALLVGGVGGPAYADPTAPATPTDVATAPTGVTPSPSALTTTPPADPTTTTTSPTPDITPITSPEPAPADRSTTPTREPTTPAATTVAPVPGPATPPADGVGPSAGQVDLYLALTADRERATAQLLQLDTALTAAKAGVSGLTVERAAAQAAIRQDQAAADAAQHGADTVASTVYQQGDDGLGVIATAITSGSEGLLDRLATLRMVRSTGSPHVPSSRSPPRASPRSTSGSTSRTRPSRPRSRASPPRRRS